MPVKIEVQTGRGTKKKSFYTKAELDSFGIGSGMEDRLMQRMFDGAASHLNSQLDQLDTNLTDLDTELNTLDSYFEDPANNIPASYTFFEGIATKELFVQEMVAGQAWIDTLTANEGWFDELTSNQAFIDDIFANTITVTDTIKSSNYNAGQDGFSIDGATGSAEFNNVVARGEFIGTIDSDNFALSGGILKSANTFQFRNAADTAYQDAQMAGLTANSGTDNIVGTFVSTDATAIIELRDGDTTANPALTRMGNDLSIVSQGGDVGLGTLSPSYKQETKGTVATTGADARFFWEREEEGRFQITATGGESVLVWERFSSGTTVSQRWDVGYDSDDILFSNNTNSNDTLKLLTSGDGRFFNNLYVEGGLFAKEFVVDQTRVMYNYSMTPEGGKISSVSGSAPNEVITFEDEAGNEFVPVSEGSILRIQERTGLSSGAIVKSIWRKVESISGNDVTLSDTGINYSSSSDVGSIEVGDYGVQQGHTQTPSLDGRIDFEVSGVDQPYISIWDAVDDVGGGFEALRVGGMDGFDASITGDTGIAGATQSDGAVFWVTEDEAKIGGFDIDTQRITRESAASIYLGEEIRNVSDENSIGIGFWRSASDTAPYPVLRVRSADTNGNANYTQIYNNDSSDWGIRGVVDGDIIFNLGHKNQIAGFIFGTSQLESSNLSGGGDGSFTTDGILINSGGYISAPNFYLDSGGAGSLGDLDVSGTLTMGTNGEITNSTGDYTLDENGLFLNSGSSFSTDTAIRWNSSFVDMGLYGRTGAGGDYFRVGAEVIELGRPDDSTLDVAFKVDTRSSFEEVTCRLPLQLPVYTDATLPTASDYGDGTIVYNSDAGDIYFVRNGSWATT